MKEEIMKLIGIVPKSRSDIADARFVAFEFKYALATHIDNRKWEWESVEFSNLRLSKLYELFPHVSLNDWKYLAYNNNAFITPFDMFAPKLLIESNYKDWLIDTSLSDTPSSIEFHLKEYSYYLENICEEPNDILEQMLNCINKGKTIITDVGYDQCKFIEEQGGILVYLNKTHNLTDKFNLHLNTSNKLETRSTIERFVTFKLKTYSMNREEL